MGNPIYPCTYTNNNNNNKSCIDLDLRWINGETDTRFVSQVFDKFVSSIVEIVIDSRTFIPANLCIKAGLQLRIPQSFESGLNGGVCALSFSVLCSMFVGKGEKDDLRIFLRRNRWRNCFVEFDAVLEIYSVKHVYGSINPLTVGRLGERNIQYDFIAGVITSETLSETLGWKICQ